MRQDRPVHTQRTKEIGLEDLFCLLHGEGFQQSPVGNSSVVHHRVDPARFANHLLHRLLHRSVTRDIELDGAQPQTLVPPQLLQFHSATSVATGQVTH